MKIKYRKEVGRDMKWTKKDAIESIVSIVVSVITSVIVVLLSTS